MDDGRPRRELFQHDWVRSTQGRYGQYYVYFGFPKKVLDLVERASRIIVGVQYFDADIPERDGMTFTVHFTTPDERYARTRPIAFTRSNVWHTAYFDVSGIEPRGAYHSVAFRVSARDAGDEERLVPTDLKVKRVFVLALHSASKPELPE